jgi:hypothetical protein
LKRGALAGSLYDLVTGDEDARVCKDIPDAACNDQPENFFLQLGANVCTKIGDELASAKLVLPQLFVAAAIRARAIRKWFWVGGSIVQGLCVMAMAAAALLLEGAAAGWTVVGLLVIFSLARGVSSVSAKDVMGKTVSKTRRGTLTGYAAAFFIIGMAHAGIRIGRKTYLVDMATAQTRATYVAVSNTAIGVVLLAGGVFGLIAEWFGTAETIGLLGLFCLAGAMGATRLDEVTR